MTVIQCDVAIVGYGPVGQMLAILLGRKGYRVAVFERWPERYPLPRAVHYDHEVARILQGVGVVQELAAITERVDLYEWRNAQGDLLLRLDQSGVGPSGWPESTMFSQPAFEAILDAQVSSLPGVTLYRGWEASGVEQLPDHVKLMVQKKGSERSSRLDTAREELSVQARYLIGADGANSFVLQHMQTALTDLGFLFDWLVVDVIPREERVWRPLCWQLCDPARPTTLVSGGKGRRRWEFMRLEGESAEELSQLETAWRLLEPWNITPQNATLERHAIYTFRARWADSWRAGRLLIAGDAAHLMPPFAGQGMGAGMRDAVNLAWKLDLVLSGRVPDHVLDTYTSERLSNVQQYIYYSVELGKIICVTDPQGAMQRDMMMLAVRENPDFATPAPPIPGLGPGVLLKDDSRAGQLFPQGEVLSAGRRGLFDDVVGRGFCLIAAAGDPSLILSERTRALFASIGGLTAFLGAGEGEHTHQFVDINGTYRDWFAANDCMVVLTRPDFYIFGSVHRWEDAEDLVNALLSQLTLPFIASAL